MKILFISFMPTHPPTRGSCVRILTQVELLKRLGHEVSFIFLSEGRSVHGDLDAMRAYWGDRLMILPYRNPALPPLRFHERAWMSLCHRLRLPLSLKSRLKESYGIDDWYDERLTPKLLALVDQLQPQAVVVEYVFFSKLLEQLPPASPGEIFLLAPVGSERETNSLRGGGASRSVRRCARVLDRGRTPGPLLRFRNRFHVLQDASLLLVSWIPDDTLSEPRKNGLPRVRAHFVGRPIGCFRARGRACERPLWPFCFRDFPVFRSSSPHRSHRKLFNPTTVKTSVNPSSAPTSGSTSARPRPRQVALSIPPIAQEVGTALAAVCIQEGMSQRGNQAPPMKLITRMAKVASPRTWPSDRPRPARSRLKAATQRQ